MKRILLLAIIALGLGLTCRANTFTILNMTGCTTSVEIRGLNPVTSLSFSSTPIIAPPGTISYLTPSSIPGLSALPASVYFYYAKGFIVSATAGYAVGNLPTGMLTSANIPSIPCQPQGMTVSFNGNSTGGNVILLLF